jgi:hypothetical protein
MITEQTPQVERVNQCISRCAAADLIQETNPIGQVASAVGCNAPSLRKWLKMEYLQQWGVTWTLKAKWVNKLTEWCTEMEKKLVFKWPTWASLIKIKFIFQGAKPGRVVISETCCAWYSSPSPPLQWLALQPIGLSSLVSTPYGTIQLAWK